MEVLAYDWHPEWISYEWWRDIGASLVGAAAATLLGSATLVVAIRGHQLAKRTTEFEQKVREDEEDRRMEAASRDEQRQRVDYAAQARRYVELLRQSKIEDDPAVPFDKLENYKSELLDTAITLDSPEDAKHLIERMNGHFGVYLFEPGKRFSGYRLSGVWDAWRKASDDIRAYVQHKPLSEPTRMELGLEGPLARKYAESGQVPPEE